MTDMRSRPKAAVSSIVSGVEGLSILASDADCTARTSSGWGSKLVGSFIGASVTMSSGFPIERGKKKCTSKEIQRENVVTSK